MIAGPFQKRNYFSSGPFADRKLLWILYTNFSQTDNIIFIETTGNTQQGILYCFQLHGQKEEIMNRQLSRYALLVMGIAFIAFGAVRGEVDTVFAKAVRICLECIGIG